MQNNNLNKGFLEFSKMINSIQGRLDKLEKNKLIEYKVDSDIQYITQMLLNKFPELETNLIEEFKLICKDEKRQILELLVISGFLYMPNNISITNYKHIDELRKIINDFRLKYNYSTSYVDNKEIDASQNFKLKLQVLYEKMISQLKIEVNELNKIIDANSALISNIIGNSKNKFFSQENKLTRIDYYNFVEYMKNIVKIKQICLDFILVASILKYDFLFFSSLEIYNLLNEVAKIPNIDGQYPNMLNSIHYFETFYKFHFYNFIN